MTDAAKDVNEVIKNLNKVELPDQASLKDQMPTDLEENIAKTKVPLPKDLPKGFGEPTTPKAKEVKERKKKEAKDAQKKGKFEVDLDNYLKFVDLVTSEESKNYDKLLERYEDLKTAGCNIARLDTAASGLVAESGEFMEIVKKMVFQGKPWDEHNRKHLIIELGDVMWYVMQACKALDVSIEEVVAGNVDKLKKRYPGGEFNVYQSENRKEGDL